ncbi:ORF142 [Janthinobacterium agaricidamnosum NBRC 102515 = DSM 9628]|uniref:ORF142 n=1 Tax=Janthinobacterium agaricidamnosum NBRC 102515 = DSM 9628 TaxID=1349767 RepID=W0V476_9BURK|nr:ORF142 [Janthinobacterium agaricidamnosum NBRC 102515 = DSM 9628]
MLSRDEHCPPHVHVGADKWKARFRFSYWHNDVQLWDVSPAKNQPTAAVLEDLRQVLLQAANLRKAREQWWRSTGSVCLDNQMWDVGKETVVNVRSSFFGTRTIQMASFNEKFYITVLQLSGPPNHLEIAL